MSKVGLNREVGGKKGAQNVRKSVKKSLVFLTHPEEMEAGMSGVHRSSTSNTGSAGRASTLAFGGLDGEGSTRSNLGSRSGT